jgi:hypothetical protein
MRRAAALSGFIFTALAFIAGQLAAQHDNFPNAGCPDGDVEQRHCATRIAAGTARLTVCPTVENESDAELARLNPQVD